MKIPKKITLDDLYIVDDCDAPCFECIARKAKNGKFYYIHKKLRNVKQFYGMTPTNPAPLKDFGLTMQIKDGCLCFVKAHKSIATYRDGRPRDWQDYHSFNITI